VSDSAPWRTLAACPACARQFDVSHLQPGAQVRCPCGTLFGARFPQPRSPRHLRCSNCGGALEASAPACPWCAAQVTLEEKELCAICPGCGARMAERARFCMECGIAIQPQALYALPAAAACPRCKGGLRQRELAGAAIVECTACGGLWLSEERFDEFCATSEARETVGVALGHLARPREASGTEQVRYLPCVVCGDMMSRRNFASASGVILDVCRKHGVWLDHSELERVLSFVREGGLDRARRLEKERLEIERGRAKTGAASPAGGAWMDAPARRRRSRGTGGDLSSWVLEVLMDGYLLDLFL
jgi:Zn-finger nucleic acid-binding protein